MIRILHVVPTMDINAGMMSVVMNYYRFIDRDKVQFDFLYIFESQTSHRDEILKMGGRVFFMPNPSFSPRFQKRLREFFLAHKGEYSAVHCHPIWASVLYAREAKRSGIQCVIQHSHSTQYSNKKMSSVRNKALMPLVRFLATDFVACSEDAALLFGKKIVENGKVTVFRNAIELGKYKYDENLRREFREEFDIPDATFVIGVVGRLVTEKNQKYAIDIFDEYHRKHTGSVLLIVGDGDLKDELTAYAAGTSAKNNIIFTGLRRDMQRVLSGFDLFLLPSLFEGVPVSAVEAQANGLELLLSDTITKSIKTQKTTYMDITQSPCVGAEVIENIRKRECIRNHLGGIAELGFDITTEAGKLSDYYQKLVMHSKAR